MNLEDELRSALRRKEPSPEFTERVLARGGRETIKDAARLFARFERIGLADLAQAAPSGRAGDAEALCDRGVRLPAAAK